MVNNAVDRYWDTHIYSWFDLTEWESTLKCFSVSQLTLTSKTR